MRRAQQSGQNPDEFIKHMVEHNHIPEMVSEVVRGKALARIVEGATVTDESGNAGRPEEPASRRQHRRPRRRGRGRDARPTSSRPSPSPSPTSRRRERRRTPTRRATRRPDRARVVDPPARFSEHLFTVRRDDASTLDAAALAADYVEDLVVGTVREVHGAVAGRVHGINDRINGGGPTVGHRLHDGISKAVYSGIRAGFRAGSNGLRAASRAGLGADIEATSRGRFVRAAVNGLIGDRLREEGSQLRLRHGRPGRRARRRRSTATGIAAAYPRADRPARRVRARPQRERGLLEPRRPAQDRGAARGPGQAQLRRTARATRAGRRSTSGSTPACRSPRTASRWRPCSTVSCRPGRSTYAGSRWWATRWAA